MSETIIPGGLAVNPLPDVLMMGPLPALETRLAPHCAIHRYWSYADKDAFLREHGARLRGICAYSGAAPVDAALLNCLPNVGIIANMGAGFDSVDTDAAKARGIVVTNAGGANAVDVAEHAVGLILAVAREIAAADRYARAGRWKAEGRMPVGRRLSGRTLGILGLGHIGRAIARCASGFDMPVYYHSRRPVSGVPYTYVETPEALARKVEILVVAAPGGPRTRHLVGRAAIDALGPDGILVNIGRGSVVDETALIDALTEGRLGGAGLDVFEAEPDIPERLLALPNVVLQPHIAGATREGLEASVQATVANMKNFFTGGPIVHRVA